LIEGTLISSYLVCCQNMMLYNSLANRISYMGMRCLKSQQNEGSKSGGREFFTMISKCLPFEWIFLKINSMK
jgi:hypothetical protein